MIPGQGLGLGRIIRGTTEMREAVKRRFGTSIPPEGPERLFDSRSKTGAAGGLICETLIESLLLSEGYEVFHPQEHDIATQIARYKAAKSIIVSDGSAGHLYAYVGQENQQVVYLQRRTIWSDGPIDQITSFTGRHPLVPETLRRVWIPKDNKRNRGVAFGLHDLEALQSALREAGFISRGEPWPRITEACAEGYLRHIAPQIEFELA